MAIIIKLYTFSSFNNNILAKASIAADATQDTLWTTIIPIRLINLCNQLDIDAIVLILGK